MALGRQRVPRNSRVHHGALLSAISMPRSRLESSLIPCFSWTLDPSTDLPVDQSFSSQYRDCNVVQQAGVASTPVHGSSVVGSFLIELVELPLLRLSCHQASHADIVIVYVFVLAFSEYGSPRSCLYFEPLQLGIEGSD